MTHQSLLSQNENNDFIFEISAQSSIKLKTGPSNIICKSQIMVPKIKTSTTQSFMLLKKQSSGSHAFSKA